jgi:PPK2 family polyphosphate:nucleotide phosphotransferase
MSKHTIYRVDPELPFRIADAPTHPLTPPNRKNLKKQLKSLTTQFAELQRKLYAQDQYSLLLIFQAMDAAGKDSTIRAVTKGVNPAGFQLFSFRQPSKLELDHDFLWRSTVRLPERGRIGIFNRSYYEETLVVRVHPEYLDAQRLPHRPNLDTLWPERYSSIIESERHLARNGTVILKFWLNVSRDEQKKRFLSRLNDPQKYWKFSGGDLKERALWDDYMHAYEDMIDATSSSFAPWFAIPADDKLWMRVQVAGIIVNTLKNLDLAYPTADTTSFEEYKAQLQSEN